MSDEIQPLAADGAASLAFDEPPASAPSASDAPANHTDDGVAVAASTTPEAPGTPPARVTPPPVTVPVTHDIPVAPIAPATPAPGYPGYEASHAAQGGAVSDAQGGDPSDDAHVPPPAPVSAAAHDISALVQPDAAPESTPAASASVAPVAAAETGPLILEDDPALMVTAPLNLPDDSTLMVTAPLTLDHPVLAAPVVEPVGPFAPPDLPPAPPPPPPVNAPAAVEQAEQAPSEPLAATREDPNFTRYYAVRAHIGPIAFSPDLTQVAYITNTSGQFNIWRQAVSGGWAAQVTTFEDESARSLIWTPSGELIAAADGAGTEQYDLFTIPATGGAPTYLTARPDAQYELSEEGLSPDGRTLAYSGNDRTPTDSDVLLRDLASGQTRRALANGRFNVAINWSPDGRYISVMDIRSNTDMRLWLLDTHDDSVTEVASGQGERYIAPGPWLPDSSGLYVITDHGREFKGIARYLLASGEMEWVVSGDWDVEQIALSADGRRLLWTLNESGRSQLHLRDLEQASLRVSGLPVGVIEYLRLTPDGQKLALRINSATAPAEVYILTLGPVGALSTPHLRRLTFGMLGGLEPAELIAPDLVSYRSHDGRDIPAWLYRPRGATDAHSTPLVVSIHGGPEAQERVEYHAFYQYLLSRGIAVLAPNIRGSSGYGKAYQKLIHRDWGGGELRDIEATAEYARALPWVDGARLGVFGGSFGGFATLSALTRLPDYWAAGVDIVGPSNLLTFARSVPPTWRRMMAAWVGDPDEDAELLRERSPITYVDRVRAPLLVMQGANDPRVAKAESDQMVERLRALGRDVEYVIFPDEGHGFTKRVNTLRGYRLASDFFQQRLAAK